MNIADGLVDFYNLVFFFSECRLVSTRAILPSCTRARIQALITRVGGDNLTIVGIFEGTYYGHTPRMFTHIFAPQSPKDMYIPKSPIYAPFPINSVLQGLRCEKCFHYALNLNPCCKREAKPRFASMQKPEAPFSSDMEIRFFE